MSTTTRTQTGPWLESPAWDGFWILNILWLTPLLGLAWVLGQASPTASTLVKLGSIGLWGGHLLSPMITSWRSPGLRAQMKSDRGRWIVRPLAVFASCIALAFVGLHNADRVVAYELLLLTFVLWNTWHFCGQHFGVLSIYRMKSGASPANSDRTRQVDRWFTFMCTCVLLPLAWFLQSERIGPLFRFLPTPDPDGVVRWLVIGASAFATLVVVVRDVTGPNRSSGHVGILLTVGLQPILAAVSYPLFNFVLFSMSHWIIALALASRILANTPKLSSASTDTPRGGTARYLIAYGALIVVSVPMYAVFWSDRLIQGTSHLTLGMFRRSSELATEAPSALLTFVVGAYFGTTFVHFLYDRALYGFRRPEVRASVAPALFASLSRG